MASYQIRQRDPLLDSTTQAVIERRGKELLGVGLFALGGMLTLILWSYAPTDPGWMSVTDEPVQNLLGRTGAALASPLIIISGYGGWGLALALMAWGLRFVFHRAGDDAVGRIIFVPIAIAVASAFAATLVPGIEWTHSFGLGGLFGDTVLGAILGVAPVQATFGLKVMSALVGLAMVGIGTYVLGFTNGEIRAVVRFLLVGVVVTYTGLLSLITQGGAGAAAAARATALHLRDRRANAAEARAYAAEQARLFPTETTDRPSLQSRLMQAVAAHVPTKALAPEPALQGRRGTGPSIPQPFAEGETRIARALRADARYAPEPAPQAPATRQGLMARMPAMVRRAVEAEPDLPRSALPEPELMRRGLSQAGWDAEAPSDDRIRSRISSAIAARSRTEPVLQAPTPPQKPLSRFEAAIARYAAPRPLVADTGRPAALGVGVGAVRALAAKPGLPSEPALTRTQPPASEGPALPTLRATPARLDMPANSRPLEPLFEDRLPHDDLDAFALAPVSLPSFPPVTADKGKVVLPAIKRPAPSRQAIAEAQPRLRFEEPAAPAYEPPPLSLLMNPTEVKRGHLSDEALEENARMLESVLDDYGVKGEITSVRPGPVVTMYELEPAPGLKASRVIGLADDIARSMSALSARVSTVPGRTVIGIELPNVYREKVVLREILSHRDFGDSNMRLPLALGKDIGGEPVIANLAKMPHLLIAGTTGSGKSVAINTMILSLLYKLTPEECRLIMIDPKMLELSVYDGIPHLLSPVVTDPKKAVVALKWVVGEMEDRYRKMSKMGVRNIEGYNGRVREALDKGEMFKRTIQTGFDDDTGEPVFETDEFQPVTIPYIVVVVDEMADLMMVAGKEIEACIQRLAQMARASGIHLIMATQRPSVDVITGTIKANFPTRISFQVTSKIDSRTILGEQGAEQLLGMGDMLYMAGGAKITRIHGPFVSDEEVEEIVTHLKSYGPPVYMSGVLEAQDDDAAEIDSILGLGSDGLDDSLYDQAVAIVAKDRKCSTSYIQRKLGIGYNKAAKLVEQMEEHSVITAANHVGKREILIEER